MKRTTIFLDDELEREVKSQAEKEGRPMAGLVREALADYLVERRQGGVPSFAGAGRSGRADVAERHEEILADEWGRSDRDEHGP